MTINESHDNINPSPLLSDEKGSREYKYKFYTFVLIALLQIFVNYDVGVVPVMLNWIQEPYDFKESELGFMGSLPYVGTVLVSPFMSFIFLRFSSQISLIVSMFMHAISLCIFGLAINKYMFFISEFLIGLTRTLFFIYYPLWVDTFAPDSNRNLWLSIIQGGIVIGMTLGYILTSLFSYAGKWSWRYSIFTQISCELILITLFYFIPKEFINFDPSRDENINFDLCTCEKSKNDQPVINSRLISINDESITKSNKTSITHKIKYSKFLSLNEDKYILKRNSLEIIFTRSSSLVTHNSIRRSRIYSNFEQSMVNPPEYSKCSKCFLNNVKLHQEMMNTKNLSFWSTFKLLIKQSVFILSCLTISSLFFEVTGIQFWMTKLGLSHYNMSEKTIHLIYSVVNTLGPVLGIISGSYLIDQIIYHYPNNPLYVDYTLITWALIACSTGVVVILFQNSMIFSIGIFIILFFGASLVPTLTLTSVAYLPPYLKPAGASFFICSYNIFGYMLGVLLPGIAVDIFNTYTAALIIIFLSGFIGLGTYMFIFYIKWKRIKLGRSK